MKNTGNLNVLGDFTLQENILIIHPNDGFDLGMMTTSYTVNICRGVSVEEFKESSGEKLSGQIELKNECPTGTIEMGLKSWEKIGKPKYVKLYYEEPDLLIIRSEKQTGS
jgi:hypothetical protein